VWRDASLYSARLFYCLGEYFGFGKIYTAFSNLRAHHRVCWYHMYHSADSIERSSVPIAAAKRAAGRESGDSSSDDQVHC
jgi:hypothetical protein